MSIGGTGVTGVAQRAVTGSLSLADQILLIKEPEKAEKLLSDISAATAAYNKAASRYGVASKIDQVLAEAQKAQAEAVAEGRAAKEKAADLIAKAEAAAAGILEKAKADAKREGSNVTTRQRRVKAREDAVKEKELEINPLHAKAKAALEEAEAEKIKAERVRSQFEARARNLKDAVKEALK